MDDFEALLRPLNQQGWVITDAVVSPQWQESLLASAQRRWDAGEFTPGEIGRGAADGLRPSIRGDAIWWVADDSPEAQHPFFEWMARFRHALNDRYDMGLRSQEFHFARYGSGQGYKKHIDQHRGVDYRKVSIVLYLNQQWDPTAGGELCLYEPRAIDVEMLRIAPLGGRLVIFVSGVMPHEVLPCRRTRWSLTGWLRTDAG